MALYTVFFDRVIVTAVQDLFEINTATDSVTIIHAVELSQSTELGDAAEEMLPLIFKRANPGSTSGSGGTVPVSNSLESGSSAYGGTTEVNNTTRMAVGTGTIQTLRVDTWNIRMPYLWLPTPEMRPILGINSRFGVELPVAPIDAITMSGTCTFEELGG
jgi:hypothetical protein